MIHDELVTYEVAKLAREKGFDEATYYTYDEESKQLNRMRYCVKRNSRIGSIIKLIAAPTQSLLQRWLRETHNLHIYVGVWGDVDEDADGLCCGTYSYWSFNIQSCFTGDLIYEEFEHRYDTYELALEDALKYTLENLI